MEKKEINTTNQIFLNKKVDDTIILNIVHKESQKVIIDNVQYEQVFFTKESDFSKASEDNELFKLFSTKLRFIDIYKRDINSNNFHEYIESIQIPNKIQIKKWIYSKGATNTMDIKNIILIISVANTDYVCEIKPYIFYELLQNTIMTNTDFLNTHVSIASEKTRDFFVTEEQLTKNIQRKEKLNSVELKIGNIYLDEKSDINYVYLGKYPMFNFISTFKYIFNSGENYLNQKFKKTLKPLWIREDVLIEYLSNQIDENIWTNSVEDLEKVIRIYLDSYLVNTNLDTNHKFISDIFKPTKKIIPKKCIDTLFNLEDEKIALKYVEKNFLGILSEYINNLYKMEISLIKPDRYIPNSIVTKYLPMLNNDNPFSYIIFNKVFTNIRQYEYSLSHTNLWSVIKSHYYLSHEKVIWRKFIVIEFRNFSNYVHYKYQNEHKIPYYKQLMDALLTILTLNNNKPTVNEVLEMFKPNLEDAFSKLNQISLDLDMHCPEELQNQYNEHISIINNYKSLCNEFLSEMRRY